MCEIDKDATIAFASGTKFRSLFAALLVGDIASFIGLLPDIIPDPKILELLQTVFSMITMNSRKFKDLAKSMAVNDKYKTFMKKVTESILKPLLNQALQKLPVRNEELILCRKICKRNSHSMR